MFNSVTNLNARFKKKQTNQPPNKTFIHKASYLCNLNYGRIAKFISYREVETYQGFHTEHIRQLSLHSQAKLHLHINPVGNITCNEFQSKKQNIKKVDTWVKYTVLTAGLATPEPSQTCSVKAGWVSGRMCILPFTEWCTGAAIPRHTNSTCI